MRNFFATFAPFIVVCCACVLDTFIHAEEERSLVDSTPDSFVTQDSVEDHDQENLATHPETLSSDEKINKSNDDTGSQAKRLWGSAGGSSHGINSGIVNPEPVATEAQTGFDPSSHENSTKIHSPSNHIPFLASKPSSIHHDPPEGFELAGRVYLDPRDRLAHFDDDPRQIKIPYWDCGATGATTSPLALKNGFFRQTITSASTSWTGIDGMHPTLVVALSPLVIDLNSGESKAFDAGDVILLEDLLLPGHRMRSSGAGDLKILSLSLPQKYYHAGKEQLSLRISSKAKDPCPNESFVIDQEKSAFQGMTPTLINADGLTVNRIRRIVLVALGTSLSTWVADFLGKTAPLWLAVGVGGICFVGGSTFAFTALGEWLLTAIDLAMERRRLERTRSQPIPEVEKLNHAT